MLLQLLIVGHTERAEASPLAGWIAQHLRPAQTRFCSSMDEALAQWRAQEWNPDLVVIFQSWPDEYSPVEIDQLSRLAPLARWVVCHGSWCESDGRTRDLWPLAVRVPLRSAESRLTHEWQLLNGAPVASLPMSASREEAFGVDHEGLQNAERPVTVAVSSADPEYQRYLTEFLARLGHTVVDDADDVADPSVWLIDLDPWDEQRRDSIRQIRAYFPGPSLIGLMNLSAPELTEELLEMGVAEVLPKLGSQQQILDAVARCADVSTVRLDQDAEPSIFEANPE